MDIIWGLFRAFLDQIVFNTIGLIVVMFVVCMVLYRPGMGFKFFLFWLAVCAAVFYFVDPSAGIWGFLSYFKARLPINGLARVDIPVLPVTLGEAETHPVIVAVPIIPVGMLTIFRTVILPFVMAM